ncbi:MAG: tetratricopeptide repeat protein, partial [Acidobacteriota bacterium]
RGLVAALRGRDGRALESYLASLELVPEQPDVLLRAAGGLAKLGRFEDAIGLYDRLESLEPAWAPAVWERRGTAWVNLGRADEAIADFDRAVDAAPEDALLRSRYAAALEHLGRRADAQRRAAADLSAGSDPQTRAALAVERARGQLRSGALEEAMASYREALGAQPDHLPARRGLAQLLAHHGRFGEAVEHLEQVLEASPRHEGARRDHAVALVLAERYGEARLALQEALRLFPRHLGFALTQVELLSTTPDDSVRDGDLAVRIAERITAENDGAVARQSLAFAYAAAGRFDDAKRVQRRLLEEAEAGGNEALIAELRSRLERFEAGRPQIAAAPTDIVFPLVAGR